WTSVQRGPLGSPSCLNRRGASMAAAIPGEHHRRFSAYRKNERNAVAHVATGTRHQPSRPFDSRKASTSATVIDAIEALLEETWSRKPSICHRRLLTVFGDKPRSSRR